MKSYLALCLALTAMFIGCKPNTASEKVSLKGEAFGTTYAITTFGSQQQIPVLQNGIDSIIAVVNQSMSTYIPKSDISRINRGDTTVVVDAMFKEVFALSRNIYQKTDRYFDPTVGGLRNAYGFGDTKPLNKIDSSSLDSMMQFVGLDKVSITDKGRVNKEKSGIYLDFNAIAKGYGIDRIAVYLQQQEHANFLIELGGELRALGINIESQKPWTVGVEDINSEVTNRSHVAVIALEDKAMASSGNYRKNRVDPRTNKQYVHTINPLTGEAQQSDVLSATVIANTCAIADAYATSFMAMGLDKSKALLANLDDIDAYLIYSVALDSTAVFTTPGFAKLQLR